MVGGSNPPEGSTFWRRCLLESGDYNLYLFRVFQTLHGTLQCRCGSSQFSVKSRFGGQVRLECDICETSSDTYNTVPEAYDEVKDWI